MHRAHSISASAAGATRPGPAASLLIVAVALLAASAAGVHAQSPGGKISRYLIVSGDSSSGSWDSHDEPRFKEWRARYGGRFAWFRQDGHDYLVTGQVTLDDLDEAMAPQREVNRQQSEVNLHQADVNRMQAGVNGQQTEVNRAQAEVNREQALVNQHAAEQSTVNRMQSDVNDKQHAVNAEQQKVNRAQEVVNQEQGVVNKLQTRVSAEVAQALQGVFDAARIDGLAREIR